MIWSLRRSFKIRPRGRKTAHRSYPELGWDGINYRYWCRHRSKVCSLAHRLPSEAFRQFGRQGYSKEQTPPQSRVYRQVHTDRSDLLYYNIQIFRRKFLESTETGSWSSPLFFPFFSLSQQNLVSRKHGQASGSQNLVFGKIKDAPSPSQRVGA